MSSVLCFIILCGTDFYNYSHQERASSSLSKDRPVSRNFLIFVVHDDADDADADADDEYACWAKYRCCCCWSPVLLLVEEEACGLHLSSTIVSNTTMWRATFLLLLLLLLLLTKGLMISRLFVCLFGTFAIRWLIMVYYNIMLLMNNWMCDFAAVLLYIQPNRKNDWFHSFIREETCFA